MFTVDLANDLCETKIKANSVSPGYVAAEINDIAGTDTIEEGATAIVRLANCPKMNQPEVHSQGRHVSLVGTTGSSRRAADGSVRAGSA